MSVTIVIDPELRAKVAAALSEMSRAHPRSIARLIRPEFYATVIEAVSEDIDIGSDFDAALVIATARVRERMPHAFIRTRMNPNAMTIF